MADSAFGEAGDQLTDNVFNPKKRDWSRWFDIRVRPKLPGNPLTDLLSEDGARAQGGLMETFAEIGRRDHYDLASENADFEGYYEDRQKPPLESHQDRQAESGGDDEPGAFERAKDWLNDKLGRGDSDAGAEDEPSAADRLDSAQESLDEAERLLEELRLRERRRLGLD